MENLCYLLENVNANAKLRLEVTGQDLLTFSNDLIARVRAELAIEFAESKQERYLDKREVKELFKVCDATLWHWNRKGYLAVVKVGNKVRYRLSDIKRLLNYLFKRDAELLDSQGVDIENKQSLADSFRLQSLMNDRGCEKFCAHFSLNFSAQDADKLTDEFMVQLAHEYLSKMGIVDTQHIIVRHHDRNHPHCHVLYNAVNNRGRVISSSNERYRSAAITREMKLRHGLYFGADKNTVNISRLQEPELSRYHIYKIATQALEDSLTIEQFCGQMTEKGVSVKLFSRDGKVVGIGFVMNGRRFAGGKVDKQLTIRRICYRLNQNSQIQTTAKGISIPPPPKGAPSRAANGRGDMTMSPYLNSALRNLFGTGAVSNDSRSELDKLRDRNREEHTYEP